MSILRFIRFYARTLSKMNNLSQNRHNLETLRLV